MERTIFLLALFATSTVRSQELYFPPNTAGVWETVDPASLGWCTEAIPPLIDHLGTNNTKAFIVLKDGRIAIEHYFGTFTQDSVWYWASAGKSLTAFLVGMAQEDGLLDIDLPSSIYLGTGWTSCSPTQEAAITVRHQLTMTTGLDDGTGDVDCTDPGCLQYLADPGTRWAYHNAPYTKLDGVITGATGQTLNGYLFQQLTPTTGITGLYISLGFNNVFFSTPRTMARFGLLAMNNGTWNGTPVLADQDYFTAMTTPSQFLNNSYGYLWWLNGQESFMVPSLQVVFPGSLMPNEPADAINALGKNGQMINIVPSQGLVVVRMGNVPGGNMPVPTIFNNEIWGLLNDVLCTPTGISPSVFSALSLAPNPANDAVLLPQMPGKLKVEVFGVDGRRWAAPVVDRTMDVSGLPQGSYVVRIRAQDGTFRSVRLSIVR